jgi:hypothetical protein
MIHRLLYFTLIVKLEYTKYYSFSCGSTAQFWALAASIKLSVSFRLLDLGQSAGLLGRVISLLQGLCVSAPGDCEDGEVGGMNGFGKGNRSTRRKPAPTPLCPPQISLSRPGREPGSPRWEASDEPLKLWCGLHNLLYKHAFILNISSHLY